jgi:hypothetical protein
VLIEFFEVPPDADEAFLADWRLERGAGGATLYRAIRDDTPVRFVSVAPGDSHELIHEDGDVGGPGGVVEITTFGVAELLPTWQRRHEIETARRGYLGTTLYRGSADLGYVAITRWSSPLMVFRTTQQPEFQQASADLGVHSSSALYTRS